MDYDKIILELLDRIKTLEDKVAKIENADNNHSLQNINSNNDK